MRKELKPTFLNHLRNLKWLFFMTIGYYAVLYLLFQDIDVFFSKDFYFVHLWIVWQVLVVLYIHIRYFGINMNSEYLIDKNCILSKTQERYCNTEIAKIVIHKSYNLSRGRSVFLPFQYYKYCEVVLKEGNKIILTSLLNYNIDEYLKENLKGVLFENDDASFNYFLW